MTSPRAALAPALLVVSLAGCDILGLDSYDEPSSSLTGQVVYDGQPIGVRNGEVELELWEPGWDLDIKIPVHVNHDGSFSAVLFDGDYELNLLPGNGPWLDDPERLTIEVRGDTDIQVPVVPYYMIGNETLANNDGTIEATFDLREIDGGRAIEYVGVYVGVTTFVDRTNMDVRTEVSARELPSLDDGPVTLSVELPESIWVKPEPGEREEVFVRVGVKAVGVAEMLFSQVASVGI